MKRIAIYCLCLCFLPFTAIAQNKLDKSKKELSEKKQSSNNSRTSSSSSSSFDSDEDTGELAEAALFVFQYTVGAAWVGLVGQYENEDHLHNALTKHPYYFQAHGNYFNDEIIDTPATGFRIDLKDKFIYSNSSLFGNHLDAKIRPSRYFYLKADYYQLLEMPLQDDTNNLSLFYFNFAYDRIRFERFNLGWTLGASYVGSGVDKGGFSYGLNAEYFLNKPLSFSAAAKWSHINGYPVNAYEAEASVHRKNMFITLGVEHLKIASPTYTFATVGAGIYF
ncbi:hypothetical protein [Flavobacterium suzhouense]|uniref:Uncharacterized protein n=1 Tax=Flavobacterium suzhouense TaxID=1529638 RepID=A0ABW5NUC2_9FLAO